MPHLPSLAEKAVVIDVLKTYGTAGPELLALHEAVMRGEGALSEGERELIAAFVSELNHCGYCHAVHSGVAKLYGLGNEALTDPKMAPLLAYAEKLTKTPAAITDHDAKAVLEAGWSEQALYEAILVVAMFNFMNRFVEGAGLRVDPDYAKFGAKRLKDMGYKALIKLL